MNVSRETFDNTLVLKISGRLDSDTVAEVEAEIQIEIENQKILGGLDTLILDFGNLEYISSSGVRVVLTIRKMINRMDGNLIIKNANKNIIKTFKLMGFDKAVNFK